MINNTISIVDGIEPYKTYEFKFDGEFYNKNIEIPNENLYYITITAITPDRELLSYKSFLIDKDYSDDNQSIDWLLIIIIIIVVLVLILLILIIHCILKKRKNKIEDNELVMEPIINNENNLEE